MPVAEQFLSLSAERQALAFEQAAAGRAGQSVILEKDFWVSWLLGLLFSQTELAPHLVFKGGTSLSKVYGVIDRFSEDIDLCLVPEFVGADAAGFDALGSRVKRDAAVLEMQRLCAHKTQELLMPLLEQRITQALGQAPKGTWLRYELDTDAKSPIVYFRYPSAQAAGFAYLAREVKLELGTLTDQQPTENRPVRPLLGAMRARGRLEKPRLRARLGALRPGATRQLPAGAGRPAPACVGAGLCKDAAHVPVRATALRRPDRATGQGRGRHQPILNPPWPPPDASSSSARSASPAPWSSAGA